MTDNRTRPWASTTNHSGRRRAAPAVRRLVALGCAAALGATLTPVPSYAVVSPAEVAPRVLAEPPIAEWRSHLSGPGLDDNVLAATVWDDGSGPALYAGGLFRTAGGHVVNRIARFDGQRWSPLAGPDGTGVDAQVFALAVYDGDLIAAGTFTRAGGVPVNRVARFDGHQWSPLGSGIDNGQVRALAVFDGELIAAGAFTSAGGVAANRVARWNGDRWAPLGTGIPGGTVLSLAVFGEDLVAGGNFTTIDGITVNRVARFDGQQWAPLGSGLLGGFGSSVNALTTYDGELVAAGSFVQTGDGVPANRVARFDGAAWSPLSGPDGVGTNATVHALTVRDGALVAAGDFSTAGGVSANLIARFDGNGWSPLPGPAGETLSGDSVRALTVFAGDLIVGGAYGRAGGLPVNRIARFDGERWAPLLSAGDPPSLGLSGDVHALAAYRGDLIAAGRFSQAGGQVVNQVTRWDGQRWVGLGPAGDPSAVGVDGPVWAMTVFRGELIVAGDFTRAGQVAVANIAAWDGTRWRALPAAEGAVPGTDRPVRALAVFRGELVVAGQFTHAGGVPASRIARFDGTAWAALGEGIDSTAAIPVEAITLFDGDLIAAGQFTGAGGQPADNIARFDGAAWSPLSGATGTGVNGRVKAMTTLDEDLIVAGGFTAAGGMPANWVARWDGTQWFPLAEGLQGGCCSPFVRSLAVVDGDLVAGGVFTHTAAGTLVNQIARFDGQRWWPLTGPDGTGLDGGISQRFAGNPATSVEELLWLDGRLVAGGSFSIAGGIPNWGIAQYGRPMG